MHMSNTNTFKLSCCLGQHAKPISVRVDPSPYMVGDCAGGPQGAGYRKLSVVINNLDLLLGVGVIEWIWKKNIGY